MPLEAHYLKLVARADRSLGSLSVSEAMPKVRAVIGPLKLPPSEPLAQAALDKLHAGQIPNANELTALEIVVRLLRPVVFCRNGMLDDLPEAPGHDLYPDDLNSAWANFRARVAGLLESVGRIELYQRHIGSGFLVGPELLATNRHVLGAMTFGSEVLTDGSARVVFAQELGRTNNSADIVPILGVAAIHPTLDVVLLRVPTQRRAGLKLSATTPRETARVVAVGFPGDDQEGNPLFLEPVFGGKFGVKRAAIGEVLDGAAPPLFCHDCSTTRGNSGSPVFSLESGDVVGMHRSGYFMYRNEGIDALALQEFVERGVN